jgi:hypothetical protein
MKRYVPIVTLLACAVLLAFGIVRLFELRFDVGDVYPQYSTLRSDPLGAMAFYESLEALPGLRVQRDFSTANRLPAGTETTYFHIGAPVESWRRLPDATFDEIERFATSGGRLVIMMFPERADAIRLPEIDKPPKLTTLRQRWGVDFQLKKLEMLDIGGNSTYIPAFVENRTGLPLPSELDWNSGFVFTNVDQAWTPVYTRGDDPVVIERKFGRGSIVMSTDSYFLSNEAMQRDREPELLAWFIGPGRNIIFDEAHLGVTESPGVATLIRKYRLQWFVAGLMVLAGLFVWRNSVSLLPPRKGESRETHVAGKDAAAGFDNLLRRSIPKRELLATCFAEWKKSIGQTGKYAAHRIQQAEAVVAAEKARPEKNRDPVRAYQSISRILRVQVK